MSTASRPRAPALRAPRPVPAGRRAASKPGKIDGVVARLGGDIARGAFAPGASLPRERDLESSLGASRSVVREAVKILATKGLVSVGPRVGTRVQPRRDWSLLDPDVLRWISHAGIDRDLLLALDEARSVVEPGAAAIAAARATDADRGRIRAAYEAMVAACDDPPVAIAADKAFHLAILDATHNPVLRGFRVAVDAILDAVFEATIPMLRPNLPNHDAVARAIEAGDAEGARRAMDAVLGRTSALIVAGRESAR